MGDQSMSNKVIPMLGVLVGGLALIAGTTQGCGGGSSGSPDGGNTSAGNFTQLCTSFCNKDIACTPNIPPAETATAQATCMTDCMNNVPTGATSTNSNCPSLTVSVAESKLNACLSVACSMLDACVEAICPSGNSTGTGGTTGSGNAGTTGSGNAGTTGSGNGGTTGGGGSSGAGGSTAAGTTCDTACAKADNCSAAINALSGDAGAPTGTSLKATCENAPTAAEQASVVNSCNEYLTTLAPLLGAQEPAACK